MSSCPPQDFYLLVPTLFHHIVLACSTNNLSEEGLKGGLEYLVDTFLLPSLIPGITWLSSHLWESRGDANAVLQILSALITNPSSISNNTEASQMLNAILNIIAKNLEHSLRWLQRAEPQRQDVEPLSKALRVHLGWERKGGSEHTELESWTSTPGGGLVASIKQTIMTLVQWGLNPGINIMPASYTHRQILIGVKLLGAKRLLNAIIEEVKSQTETGNGSVVIDIATALICSPDAASFDASPASNGMILLDDTNNISQQPLQRRLTLREALKTEAENAPKVHKEDVFHAETVVRLYRRVEAQMAVQQNLLGAHDDEMAGIEKIMGDVGHQHQQDLGDMGAAMDGMVGDGGDLMGGLMDTGNIGGGTDLLDGFGGGDHGMGF